MLSCVLMCGVASLTTFFRRCTAPLRTRIKRFHALRHLIPGIFRAFKSSSSTSRRSISACSATGRRAPILMFHARSQMCLCLTSLWSRSMTSKCAGLCVRCDRGRKDDSGQFAGTRHRHAMMQHGCWGGATSCCKDVPGPGWAGKCVPEPLSWRWLRDTSAADGSQE